MIRISLKIVVMFLFSALVYALICFQLFSARSQSTANLYQRKSLLIEKTRGPRIILIGGSNVLYGIDSDMLTVKMGMPVINMGLNADLGLRFMTEFCKAYLKPGDIVILSPEYEHLYDKNNYYGSFKLVDLIADDHDSAKFINKLEHKFHLLLLSPTTLLTRSLYGTYSYNPPITESGAFLWDEISLQNKVKLPQGNSITGSDFKDIFPDIIDYRKTLVSKKVKLYLSFPYIPSSIYSINRKSLSQLYRQFTAASFDVLAPPETCALSEIYFYDSIYHLNAVGRILRTEQLAAQLQEHLSNELPR